MRDLHCATARLCSDAEDTNVTVQPTRSDEVERWMTVNPTARPRKPSELGRSFPRFQVQSVQPTGNVTGNDAGAVGSDTHATNGVLGRLDRVHWSR